MFTFLTEGCASGAFKSAKDFNYISTILKIQLIFIHYNYLFIILIYLSYNYSSLQLVTIFIMTQKRHLYKSSPFVASASSRKRGRKKSNKAALASPKKKLLISRNKGSWFPNTSNEEIENQIETSSCSSSYKKLVLWKEVRRESQYEVSDRCHWVIDMNILETYIKDVAVCKECSSELSLDEMVEYRMGLGTRFRFSCKNVDCSSHINNHGFSTTNKKGKMYEINRKSVLAGRIVGKGRSGSKKYVAFLS